MVDGPSFNTQEGYWFLFGVKDNRRRVDVITIRVGEKLRDLILLFDWFEDLSEGLETGTSFCCLMFGGGLIQFKSFGLIYHHIIK